MDFMDVYTLYTLSHIAALTACVILSALINAFLAVRVRKDALLAVYLAVQALLLLWIVGKILELVAPVLSVAQICAQAQWIVRLLLLPVLALFFAFLRRKNKDGKFTALSAAVFLADAVLTLLPFFPVSFWVSDLSPELAFAVISTFAYWGRRDIFTGLSDLSIDLFADRIEDAVILFDSSDRFMDSNKNALKLFPFLGKRSSLRELYGYLAGHSGPNTSLPTLFLPEFEPFDLALESGSGLRYFRVSAARAGNETRPSTVMTFSDVTERTKLLRDLEGKNRALKEKNEELKRYIDATSRLENEQEKYRAAMEIQQRIGQSIAELLIGLEAMETAAVRGEDPALGERLDRMIESCRMVMSEIRKSVSDLTD
ncbi:hypothetical protein [Papillibacter cinnamivorans]|uniref:Histidine kinase N-terminal 7TM region domain-containing protein n=1 Tax=Papillibacter cinnamivorans DSM 12816 TaxID=1122930 RepID=A0A1W1YDC3_9FIRM|nr:hypothetical protein [Papillibacter cinnamivorans]SMC34152.1 hypothetical protein SAMN02745168_0345 [Papillibacter cinnamivorans DSM 12816]